jgi:hypothetical protein
MSVAPNAGIVDFGTFTSPTTIFDGIQGQVPQPLAGQETYVLTAIGWAPSGGGGNSSIGGYPVNLSGTPNNYDALMFLSNQWVNIPQTEISDGGNY